MIWYDMVYFKLCIRVAKLERRIVKRRRRRELIKYISTIVARGDREIYSSFTNCSWSFEDVKQVCQDMGLAYKVSYESYGRIIEIDYETIHDTGADRQAD